MKVYVVLWAQDHAGSEVDGVYATEQRANRVAAEENREGETPGSRWIVQAWDVQEGS